MEGKKQQFYAYRPVKSKLLRVLLLACACICLILGTLGFIIPGLPTLDFYVLACLCASKSSRRLHDWLQKNRFFAKLLSYYSFAKQGGLALPSKLLMSFSLMIASYFIYQSTMHLHLKYALWLILIGIFLWIWLKVKWHRPA